MKSIKQKIVKINASGRILGRLATEIANVLRGKNKPDFNYHQICGDKVRVYNIGEIIVSGTKAKQKKYFKPTKYIGNLKIRTYEEIFKKNPIQVLFLAVKGMLPKNRLQKQFLKNLSLFRGEINDKS